MAKFQDKYIRFAGDRDGDGPVAHNGKGGSLLKCLSKRITAADFTAAALTESIDLFTVPANAYLFGIGLRIDQLAADSPLTATSARLDCGTAANPDGYIDDVDVLSGSGSTGTTSQAGDNVEHFNGLPQSVGSSAQAVQATLTSDVNVSTIDELAALMWVDFYVLEDPEG